MPGKYCGPGNAASDHAARSAGWQQARVLVIDDHGLYRALMGALLENLGVCHAVFSDAHSALRALAEEPFDLVISDCRMPVVDGYAMTRALRRLEREAGRTRVPVIALTGRVGPDEIRRCVECGMDGWLLKPISLEQLREVLRYWLPGPGLASRAQASLPPQQQGLPSRAGLIATFGSWAVVEPMLSKLIQEAREDLAVLLQARVGADAKLTTQRLHRLVGSVAFLGTTALEQQAVQLIDQVHSNGVSANRVELERFHQAIERYLHYLGSL